MSNVVLMDHPLIQHKIGVLRDKNTGSKDFRHLIEEISMLMCYDATRDLAVEDVEVETPMGTAIAKRIKGKMLAFVPMLRAGLTMVDGMVQLVPGAKIGHIGIYRDDETDRPVEYYCKLPIDCAEREVILLDPMLATGHSISAAIELLQEKGIRHIRLICIVAAPDGIAYLEKNHPEIPVYVGAIDEKISDDGYIVPGLGDVGDRMFGTK